MRVVKDAMAIGYRGIDTAAVYKNEAEIGHALKEVFAPKSVKRSDLFITTKIPSSLQGYDNAIASIKESLAK